MQTLGWCDNCNVPVLDGRKCGICGLESRIIRSNEVKPVFDYEKTMLKKMLRDQNLNEKLIPKELCFRDIQGYTIADGLKFARFTFSSKDKQWFSRLTNACGDRTTLRGSNIETMLKANEYILKEKEREVLSFLKESVDRCKDLPLAVSFSGGKDSVVALSLTKEIEKDFDVVFLDTTIELPETVAYTEEIARLWNLRLVSVKPDHDFLNLCKLIGPPSRFMKWCCKTQKFSSMNKLLHERYPDGVLMVRGIRAAESNKRGSYKRFGKFKWTPNETIVNPIIHWTSLDCWLYIFWKHIPYNKAYNYGFARIGCWACPEKSMKDFALVKKSHPELIAELYSILDGYIEKRNLDRKWIDSGDWRYRKSRITTRTVCATRPCSSSNDFVFTIDDREAIGSILEFFKIFGPKKTRGAMSRIDGKEVGLSVIGKSVRIDFKEESRQEDILRLLARALNCIGCGACQGVCPKGAIRQVDGKRIIDNEKCTGCLKCLSFFCVSLRYGANRLSVSFP